MTPPSADALPATPDGRARPRWRRAARQWLPTGVVALGATLTYLVATRLAIFLVATAVVRLAPGAPMPLPAGALALPRSLRPWLYWDAGWYLSIAERGYWFAPAGQSNVAFFPLYPALIALLGMGTGNLAVSGLTLANAAAVGATIILWHWVRAEADAATADESVRWLLVYPFSFFLHSAHAESTALLLTCGALFAARRRRWPIAAVLAALAAVTRPMGILLVPALAVGLWLDHRRGTAPPRPHDWLAVGLAPGLLLAHLGYLWHRFGTPLAFWQAHVAGWDVRPSGDLLRYARELRWVLRHRFPLQGYMQVLTTSRVVLPLVFLALAVPVFRRLGPVAGLYTLLVVAVGTMYGFESAGREYLAAAPVFAVAGMLSVGRQLEWLRMLSVGVLLVAFVNGRFVG